MWVSEYNVYIYFLILELILEVFMIDLSVMRLVFGLKHSHKKYYSMETSAHQTPHNAKKTCVTEE